MSKMKLSTFFRELADWSYFFNSKEKNNTRGFLKNVHYILTTKTNRYDIFISVLIVLIQFFPYLNLIERFWNWNGEYFHFPLTAWLTSYDGGFIRRGLSGEIIKIFEIVTNLLPHVIIVIISLGAFVILLSWTIVICGKKLPIYVIFSPVLFGLTSRYDIIYSLDYILLLSCLICLRVMILNINIILKYYIINIICTVTILMHEMYFFTCLPVLMLIYNLNEHNKIFSLKCLHFFQIPLIAMVIVSLNTGATREMVEKIAEYWNLIYSQKAPDLCCFETSEYFTFYFLPWKEVHFQRVLSFWKTFHYGFIWLPLIWVILWYLCGLFAAKLIMQYDNGKEKIFLGFYYFCSLCSLPLYILATDYGRFLLMTTIVSLFATYTIPRIFIPNFIYKFQIRYWKKPLKTWQKALFVTCFGIPTEWYNIGSYYYSTAIWYPLHFFIDVHQLALLGLL